MRTGFVEILWSGDFGFDKRRERSLGLGRAGAAVVVSWSRAEELRTCTVVCGGSAGHRGRGRGIGISHDTVCENFQRPDIL